jgi:hypothetical protein
MAMTRLAALLAVVLAGPAAGQVPELGRLFFTPAQRAELDARRRARVPDKPAAAPVTESPITRVNGAVRRAGGKSTVWVNGEMIPEGTLPDAARLLPRSQGPGRVAVPAGEGSKHYDLRVGESLDRGSGEVRDVIGNGEIKVAPGRTAPAR